MPDVPAAISFTMPSLGADMEAGTIVEWRVSPGSEVHRGDVIAVVETDKSDLDVEVFHDAVVLELLVQPGEKVPVGTPLARLGPAGTTLTAAPPVTGPAAKRTTRRRRAPAPPAPVRARVPPQVASPVLRHRASELHLDLGHVAGSGPGGRVTRDDIEAAGQRVRATPRARRLARERGLDLATLATGRTLTGDDVLALAVTPPVPAHAEPAEPPDRPVPTPPATAPSAATPPDSMRQAIARVMTRSWQEIPHYQVGTRIDLHVMLERLSARNAAQPVTRRVLPAAVLLSAAARAAAEVPEVNGHWVDGAPVPSAAVHLGIVVAVRTGGLLAPVLRDADTKDLDTVMAELRDLVTRARSGRLRASEISGATFTVTELGEGAVERVVPIIHPPQVAIAGFGSIHDEAWADNGMVGGRPVVHVTLAADHRAIDGRLGSLYLTALARLLQEPLP
jgi:pyruvate dehydrogenase E2 component (dihydrolipoamide acetyltransferase)